MAYAARSKFSQLNRGFFPKSLGCQRCAFDKNTCRRTYASQDVEELDKPIKYTTSAANSHTARGYREKISGQEQPLAQSLSLIFSVGIFLLYFGVLREENDLDERLDKDLYSTVPQLKEVQGKMSSARARDMARQSFT